MLKTDLYNFPDCWDQMYRGVLDTNVSETPVGMAVFTLRSCYSQLECRQEDCRLTEPLIRSLVRQDIVSVTRERRSEVKNPWAFYFTCHPHGRSVHKETRIPNVHQWDFYQTHTRFSASSLSKHLTSTMSPTSFVSSSPSPLSSFYKLPKWWNIS